MMPPATLDADRGGERWAVGFYGQPIACALPLQAAWRRFPPHGGLLAAPGGAGGGGLRAPRPARCAGPHVADLARPLSARRPARRLGSAAADRRDRRSKPEPDRAMAVAARHR